MSQIPDIHCSVKGFDFSIEGVVIVALMRKLGVTEIKVSELDLSEAKGLLLGTDIIRFEEFHDADVQ